MNDVKSCFCCCGENLKRRFPWILTIVFFVMGIWGILHHEPWRDEFQPWLLGRDFDSIWSLIAQARYEGHPSVWHLTLYFLSRIWSDSLAMQLIHISIASTAIFLFLRFSPFTILQKILFAFSYFFFYEYALISRDYALGWLWLTIYFILWLRNPKSLWILTTLLVLMCNTNAMIFLVSCSLALFLFGENFLEALRAKKMPSMKILAPFAVFLLGVFAALWQLIPQSNCAIYPGIPAGEFYFNFDPMRMARVLRAVVSVYFPLQDWPSSYFWSSNLLIASMQRCLSLGTVYWISISAIGIATLIIAACFFITRPRVLGVFIVGSGMLMAFFYFKYFGGIRHAGHMVLVFIYSLWMVYALPVEKLPQWMPKKLVKIGEFFDRKRNLLITLFAAFCAVAGIYAYTQDLARPFTASRTAAAFVKTLDPRIPLTGAPDYILSAFPSYLKKPVYFLDSLRYGTYVHWDHHRVNLDFSETIKRLSDFVGKEKECVLILNYNFIASLQKQNTDASLLSFEIKEISRFCETSIPDEMYFIYEIKNRGQSN